MFEIDGAYIDYADDATAPNNVFEVFSCSAANISEWVKSGRFDTNVDVRDLAVAGNYIVVSVHAVFGSFARTVFYHACFQNESEAFECVSRFMDFCMCPVLHSTSEFEVWYVDSDSAWEAYFEDVKAGIPFLSGVTVRCYPISANDDGLPSLRAAVRDYGQAVDLLMAFCRISGVKLYSSLSPYEVNFAVS